MSLDDRVPVLARVDLFTELPLAVLRRIAEAGREESFAAGRTVLAEGEEVGAARSKSLKGVEMHVVLTGTARASVDGREHSVLGPGDYFGELSLIDGGPRSAEVIAGEGGLTTFALASWTFHQLLASHPEVAVPMLNVMAGRLRAAERPKA